MDNDSITILFNFASITFTSVFLFNSIVYFCALNMKGVNRINVFLQFICLVCCWLFELTLLLINIKYTVDYPAFEALFVYIPWLVYGNCYFVVFYRQSGILLPRKLYYFCWIFLIIINAVGFYDVYLTYMQYTVSTDYYDLTTIFDFILSVMFLFIEFVVNIYIIIRIFNKVRHQSNHHYKTLFLFIPILLSGCYANDL